MIKLGFIGVGGYARTHVAGFAALQAAGEMQITALTDVSPAALAALQDLPLADAKVYANHGELLAQAELDAVVVSVPIHLHEELALAALRRGLYVLLEKPAVPTLAQLRTLMATAGQERVMVGFQHIYSNAVQTARQIIAAGELGALQTLRTRGIWPRGDWYYHRANWAGKMHHDGRVVFDGPCTNAFAHFIHNLFYLADDVPLTADGELYRARPIESYDTGCLRGTLTKGGRFFAAFSHAAAESLPVLSEVVGEHGTLRFEDDGASLIDQHGQRHANDGIRESLHLAFLRFACGDDGSNLTPLASVMGYTQAVNAALDTPIRNLAATEQNGQFIISGLPDILQRAWEQDCTGLFSC